MHKPEYGFARKSFDLKHFGSKKIAATSFVMVATSLVMLATMFTSMSAGAGSWALILMIVILDNIKEGNFEISLSIVEKFWFDFHSWPIGLIQ